MDDIFRSQHSPRGEAQMSSTLVSSPRNGLILSRRLTTDSGRVPTLSSVDAFTTTSQRVSEQSPQDLASQFSKLQLLEKKQIEYERVREQRRRFEVEYVKLMEQQQREERELAMMEGDLKFNEGHVSEPTTPPEYRDNYSGFPTSLSRPNRYSTPSLTLKSPPGFQYSTRPSRSGSQLASPQSGIMPGRFLFDDQLPSRSVPASRRNSDEDEKEEAVRQDPTSHRSTNALNRYSMPVTRSRPYISEIMDLEDRHNTASFLLDIEESSSGENRASAQAATKQDGFPTLTQVNLSSPINGGSNEAAAQSPESKRGVRRSFDTKFFKDLAVNVASASETPLSVLSPSTSHAAHPLASPPKLQPSYVSGEVATATTVSNGHVNNHAQQYLQNHNANMGRIPPSAVSNRHSRELSGETVTNLGGRVDSAAANPMPNILSTLQTAATAGPFVPASVPQSSSSLSLACPPSDFFALPANFAPPTAGHVVSPGQHAAVVQLSHQMLLNMQHLGLNASGPGSPVAVYPQYSNDYGPVYVNSGQSGNAGSQAHAHVHAHQRPRDSQARVIQSRRQMENEGKRAAMNRYNNMSLETMQGKIYELCKDQYGCRYLQRQLESRNRKHIGIIWRETNAHVVQLMQDPFGNYLCQKLFEYCNDDERTVLIQNTSKQMKRIALDQHGTRALQKMIEFVTMPIQIELVTEALRPHVVELIQDLNGNHVIQKCLTKLSADNSNFVFEAVGQEVISVGTHRHGCCVLQRCIDHAQDAVKDKLIADITEHTWTLVRDPFGNYVIQYIIDLGNDCFTSAVVDKFSGQVAALSKHKFSSNVVEKSLRCATEESKALIFGEMLADGVMSDLVRDNYGNYVIQTALDFSNSYYKKKLVDAIRPTLPSIRSTPYGRRIAQKLQGYDNAPQDSSLLTPVFSPNSQVGMPGMQAFAKGINASYPMATVPQMLAGLSVVSQPPGIQPVTVSQPQQLPLIPAGKSLVGVADQNGQTQWF